jgi:hypothetical protein
MKNRYFTKSLYNEHVFDKDPWDESANIYAKVIERIVCFEHLHPCTIAQHKLANSKRFQLHKQDIDYKGYYESTSQI